MSDMMADALTYAWSYSYAHTPPRMPGDLSLDELVAKWPDAVVLMDTSIPHLVTGDDFALRELHGMLFACARAIDPWRGWVISNRLANMLRGHERTETEIQIARGALERREWSMHARWDARVGVWVRHTELVLWVMEL